MSKSAKLHMQLLLTTILLIVSLWFSDVSFATVGVLVFGMLAGHIVRDMDHDKEKEVQDENRDKV